MCTNYWRYLSVVEYIFVLKLTFLYLDTYCCTGVKFNYNDIFTRTTDEYVSACTKIQISVIKYIFVYCLCGPP